jgi:PKD repeat protein
VRLSNAPAANVTVNTARTAGDADVTVSGGATLTFTPANYATPQTVTIAAAEDADFASDTATISVTSTGLTTRTVAVTAADNDSPNLPPTITSISFAPAQPLVGQAITFTVAASDPEAATLTYSFNYNDGTTDSTGAHTYLAAGTYTVSVTVSDGVNSVTGSTVVVVLPNTGGGAGGGGTGGGGGTPPVLPLAGVDTDGDGVSDLDEIADGTNPLDPKSVKKIAMSLQKAAGNASFVSSGRDACSVSGTIPELPALFDPTGKVLTLNVGGAKVAFTLDARGKARSNNGSIALVLKPSVRNKTTKQLEFLGGPVAFKAQLKNGTWAPDWADEGMNPAVTETGTISMVIDVLLNGKVYTTTADVSYNSKAGVGAKFKD